MVLFKLAWRNLWRRKRRAAITVSSIAFGIALCLFFTGLSDGMYGKVISAAVRVGSGHLVLEDPAYREDPGIDHPVQAGQALIETIAAMPEVEGCSRRISGPGILSSSYGSVGGSFDAVDPSMDRDVSLLARNLIDGRYLENDSEVIVGKDLARKLRAHLGSKVVLTTQDRHGETVQWLYRVVGIFETRSALVDGFAFQITLDTAQQMLDLGSDQMTQLGIYLADERQMDAVRRRIESDPGLGAAVVVPWQAVLTDLADYIKVDNASNYIFQVLLFLVILAGVLNTVLMSVMERSYEFGVLLAIGMARRRLVGMVVIECAFLGAVGTLVGGALGWLENAILYRWPISFESTFSDMTVGGFFIEPSLNMDLTLEHFLITLALVFSMILAAGLYPAWKAGQVEPVEALHTL